MKGKLAAVPRKKLVHSIDTPYTTISWPEVSQENQDAILELLCSFLSPLGQYHRSKQRSKGKRSRNRRRKENIIKETQDQTSLSDITQPEIATFVDVGLAKITRHLQEISAAQYQPTIGSERSTQAVDLKPYAMLFVARSGQPTAFYSHFPQMVAVTSRKQSDASQTRLVGYSKPCDEKLSSALGIPRVSSVGIRHGAPMSRALLEFVQEHVSPIVVPWLDEAKLGEYRKTCVKSG